MSSLKHTTTLALAALITVSSVHAQDGGYIAAGIGAAPEYEGSPDQQVIPFLAARLQSGGRSVALEGLALRADLLSSDDWEAGPVATYTFGRDNDTQTIISRLDAIDDAVELGAYAARTWSSGAGNGRTVRLAVQTVQDVSDVHDGWIATPSVSVSRALSDRLQVSTDLSANIVSGAYAQTYFGVTPAASGITGLGTFQAGGGLKDIGLSFSWAYSLSGNWSVTGVSSYRRLLSDAADSPLVDGIGDADQFTMGLGIGRSF